MTVGERIRSTRKRKGISADDLARAVGVSRTTIFRYENGDIEKVSVDKITPIANALGCSEAYLMGWEDGSSERVPIESISIQKRRIPLIGGIAAGEPILADQEYDTYIEADCDARCDYALRVDGDSMEPTIKYGDLVFIRQQDDVDDGQIAAVLLDDSATLKYVYHIPNGLQLVSENRKYPPRTVTLPNDYDTIRILGRAVAYKRML